MNIQNGLPLQVQTNLNYADIKLNIAGMPRTGPGFMLTVCAYYDLYGFTTTAVLQTTKLRFYLPVYQNSYN